MGTVTLEDLIQEQTTQQLEQQAPRKTKRPLPQWKVFIADVVIAGMLLCLFALFHHVLPFSEDVTEPIVPPTNSEEPESPAPPSSIVLPPFSENALATENSYSSPNVAITVTPHTKTINKGQVTYYVADIYLNDITCFRTAFAKDKFGQNIKESFLPIADRNEAILASSGDYYGMHANASVLRNGKVYRQRSGDEDVCVLYKDGTMKIVYANQTFDAAAEVENGAWQAWSFGPSLFKQDGTPLTTYSGYIAGKHPRCAIGYYEPGHYTLVTVDGRNEGGSDGLTIPELATLMKDLGCTVAYNLDGGRTAQMAFRGELVNQPYLDGRDVSDILYIGEVEAK